MIVYLAGGMRSGWQARVKEAVPYHHYLDPADHALKDPPLFSFWDIQAILRCDLVFAYIESDNPSGLGAAFEIGYGLGLGKRIVLVDRKSLVDDSFRKYFALVQSAGPTVLETLNAGITMLESLARLDQMTQWSPARVECGKATFEQKISDLFPVRGEVDCTEGGEESTVGGESERD